MTWAGDAEKEQGIKAKDRIKWLARMDFYRGTAKEDLKNEEWREIADVMEKLKHPKFLGECSKKIKANWMEALIGMIFALRTNSRFMKEAKIKCITRSKAEGEDQEERTDAQDIVKEMWRCCEEGGIKGPAGWTTKLEDNNQSKEQIQQEKQKNNKQNTSENYPLLAQEQGNKGTRDRKVLKRDKKKSLHSQQAKQTGQGSRPTMRNKKKEGSNGGFRTPAEWIQEMRNAKAGTEEADMNIIRKLQSDIYRETTDIIEEVEAIKAVQKSIAQTRKECKHIHMKTF
jgi:hypothetical protein